MEMPAVEPAASEKVGGVMEVPVILGFSPEESEQIYSGNSDKIFEGVKAWAESTAESKVSDRSGIVFNLDRAAYSLGTAIRLLEEKRDPTNEPTIEELTKKKDNLSSFQDRVFELIFAE